MLVTTVDMQATSQERIQDLENKTSDLQEQLEVMNVIDMQWLA